MPAVPKPIREPRPRKYLQRKSRIKPKHNDPIPEKVMDEVDERDGLTCQDCGRPVTREQHPYHHITFRSAYGKMVRLWTGLIWKMVPTWFKKHSKENLVTLCVLCHLKPHNNKLERWRWEKRRDERYYG